MTGHISKNELRRYLLGELTTGELSAFGSHIDSCGDCRLSAMNHADHDISAEVLIRELSAKTPNHLTYDEIEGAVDDVLTGEILARVEKHLNSCNDCRNEVEQLKEFASPPPSRIPGAMDRPLGMLGQLTATVCSRRWALVSALGAVVLIAGAMWLLMRPAQPPDQGGNTTIAQTDSQPSLMPVEQTPVPTQPTASSTPAPVLTISLKDGGRDIGIDGSGAIVGYDGRSSEQAEMLSTALRSGTVVVGAEAKEVISGSVKRMGENSAPEAESIHLVHPFGKVLDSGNPTFSWRPLKDAAVYRVDVFDANYTKVASSGELRSTKWKTEVPRGRTYIWQVTAVKNGTEIRSSATPEARFHTLAPEPSRNLAGIKRRYPASHLLLGLAYAEAGMIDEAHREFEVLSVDNPNSSIPRRLMTQLERFRSK